MLRAAPSSGTATAQRRTTVPPNWLAWLAPCLLLGCSGSSPPAAAVPERLCGEAGVLRTVNTTSDLTALAGCTHLLGSLRIGDTQLTGLDGLENLRIIDGDLFLFRDEHLQSLEGLRALERVGAGGSMVEDAVRSGAELFLAGELGHHDALRATRLGLTSVCTLHSNAERLALPGLAERLRERLLGVEVFVSARDRDPFSLA